MKITIVFERYANRRRAQVFAFKPREIHYKDKPPPPFLFLALLRVLQFQSAASCMGEDSVISFIDLGVRDSRLLDAWRWSGFRVVGLHNLANPESRQHEHQSSSVPAGVETAKSCRTLSCKTVSLEHFRSMIPGIQAMLLHHTLTCASVHVYVSRKLRLIPLQNRTVIVVPLLQP
jgi:hypothetical protein